MALASLWFFSIGQAAPPTNATLSKTFTVKDGGELTVDADYGEVEVRSGGSNQVSIVVERKVESSGDSDYASLLKRHHVTFSQDENIVRVETRADNSRRWFSSPHSHLQVYIKIILPRRFNLSVGTGGGNIQVRELHGAVNVKTSGGNLVFYKIDGRVDGATSGGDLKATDCTDKLTLQTGGGNAVIQDYSGLSAQVETSGGNIAATNFTGALQARTSGGNIFVEKFSGANTFLETSAGTISLDLEKTPADGASLRSSGGNLTLKMPAISAINLSAITAGGQVSSELPVATEGKIKEGTLEGKINGGGPSVTLKTSGGDIRILKR